MIPLKTKLGIAIGKMRVVEREIMVKQILMKRCGKCGEIKSLMVGIGKN